METVKLSKNIYKAHPWHGVSSNLEECDSDFFCNVYVEMTPCSEFKIELDKESGLMVIDRPRKFSNTMPCYYGFVPQSYCCDSVAAYTKNKLDKSEYIELSAVKGDQDPLDICVFSSNILPVGDILLTAKIIGGYRMIDSDEVDDKIIAVLKNDPVYSEFDNVASFPEKMLNRLSHYFLTYKQPQKLKASKNQPANNKVNIVDCYDKYEAFEIIKLSCADYQKTFG